MMMASNSCVEVTTQFGLDPDFGLALRRSESGDDHQPESDCDQVFKDSDGEIGDVKASHQSNPRVIAAERSGNAADRSQERAQPQRATSSDSYARTSEQTRDDPSAKRNGSGTGGSVGKLIRYQFKQSQQGEDANRPS
jgi:hypothetical protein